MYFGPPEDSGGYLPPASRGRRGAMYSRLTTVMGITNSDERVSYPNEKVVPEWHERALR
jgi:hypothetical protein